MEVDSGCVRIVVAQIVGVPSHLLQSVLQILTFVATGSFEDGAKPFRAIDERLVRVRDPAQPVFVSAMLGLSP